MFDDPQCDRLVKTATTLVMFNKTELLPLGKCCVEVTNPKTNEKFDLAFLVVKKGLKPLLGAPTIQRLNLMTVNKENILSIDTLTPAAMIDMHADVFEGEGKLEDCLHLELYPTIPPVKLPVRKVPLALKGPLKEELDRLVGLDILGSVDEPTDWTSAMVVVKKCNGEIRLCIDPKPLNKALKRNHYPLPVVKDVLPELAKAKVFTVVDTKNGFWHVPLDLPYHLCHPVRLL